MLKELTAEAAAGRELSEGQVGAAVEQLIDPGVEAAIKAEFLTGLARKGETVGEIGAFARALRAKSVVPPIDPSWRETAGILDVCGTGGDRLNTFNISTTVSLVCAAAGVPVAKHGNRAITSQAGSADVLEELGIRIDLSPTEAAQSLQERGFAFFFAPNYHPAFKHIAPARKLCAERGQRTIFNYLGPLLNPARPTAQLIGVPNPELCEPVARVLQMLGARRGMVVSGYIDGQRGKWLDELSTLGENSLAEFYQERGFALSTLKLDQLPLQPTSLPDLLGGNREENAAILRNILEGKERGPKRDAVLLNSGAALFVAAKARSITDGWQLAASVIDSGQALQKLQLLKNRARGSRE